MINFIYSMTEQAPMGVMRMKRFLTALLAAVAVALIGAAGRAEGALTLPAGLTVIGDQAFE